MLYVDNNEIARFVESFVEARFFRCDLTAVSDRDWNFHRDRVRTGIDQFLPGPGLTGPGFVAIPVFTGIDFLSPGFHRD